MEFRLLIAPRAMGFGQGLNSLLEPCFFCGKGLLLVPQTLEGELPLTLCI